MTSLCFIIIIDPYGALELLLEFMSCVVSFLKKYFLEFFKHSLGHIFHSFMRSITYPSIQSVNIH